MKEKILSRSIPAAILRDMETAASQAVAPTTARAYHYDERAFREWCILYGQSPLPATPETVAAFLFACEKGWTGDRERGIRNQAPCVPSTITMRAVAIARMHRNADLPSPTASAKVHLALQTIRRRSRYQTRAMRPLTTDLVRRITRAFPLEAPLCLFLFAGAFRRSEVAGLRRKHLHLGEMGAYVHLPRSKTGERFIAIPRLGGAFCPVAALEAHLTTRNVRAEDPLFLRPSTAPITGHDIGRRVKTWVAALGLDPSIYGGHSPRVGHVTEARRNGCPDWIINQQTGHGGKKAMIDRYTRPDANALFENNSVRFLGLEE